MQLSTQETSPIWWKGILTGTVKGLVVGAVVGAAVLTLGTATGFSIPILAGLGGVTSTIVSMISSGNAAVAGYHQQKHNQLQQVQEARISELEMRQQAVEMVVTPSAAVKGIVAHGPRNKASFAESELEAPPTPSPVTLH